MASILLNNGERSQIDAWLGGQSTFGSPVLIPAPGGNWGVGLGTVAGGCSSLVKSSTITTIAEVGTTSAAGYGRAIVTRDETGTGWPDPTITGGSYETTAPQVTFNFTGAPNPNGATIWFLAGGTTLNQNNALFASDLAATRVFGASDSELLVMSYQAT